jgi:zeta-carotene desaturase
MELTEEQIVERVLTDIHAVLPKSVGLRPLAARSVKEKRATFAPLPGIEGIRPSAAAGTIGLGGGGVRNLYLAGDWCDTGWPATMEGAVRSGYAAAGAVCEKDFRIDDVPSGWLASLLGLR